jgi:hypothetical protein
MLSMQLAGGREYRYDQSWQSSVVRSGERPNYKQAWMNDPAVWTGGRIGLGETGPTGEKEIAWPWVVGLAVAIGIAGLLVIRSPR